MLGERFFCRQFSMASLRSSLYLEEQFENRLLPGDFGFEVEKLGPSLPFLQLPQPMPEPNPSAFTIKKTIAHKTEQFANVLSCFAFCR